MNWIKLFTIVLILNAIDVIGQARYDVEIGVNAGITFNSINVDGRNVFTRRNISQSILTSHPFFLTSHWRKKDKKVGLIAEIGYNPKGWNELRYGAQYITKLHYAELSLLANIWAYTFTLDGSYLRFVFLGGAYGARLLDFKSEFVNGQPTPEGVDESLTFPLYKFNDQAKVVDYGVVLGIGLEFEFGRFKTVFDGRVGYGFLPLLGDNDIGNPGFIQNNQSSLRFSLYYKVKSL